MKINDDVIEPILPIKTKSRRIAMLVAAALIFIRPGFAQDSTLTPSAGEEKLGHYSAEVLFDTNVYLNELGCKVFLTREQLKTLDDILHNHGTTREIYIQKSRKYYQEGRRLQEAEDYGSAIDKYNRAIRHDHKYALAYGHLGESLLALGDTLWAEHAFRGATNLDETLKDVWFTLSAIYSKTGRPDEAEEAMRKYNTAVMGEEIKGR